MQINKKTKTIKIEACCNHAMKWTSGACTVVEIPTITRNKLEVTIRVAFNRVLRCCCCHASSSCRPTSLLGGRGVSAASSATQPQIAQNTLPMYPVATAIVVLMLSLDNHRPRKQRPGVFLKNFTETPSEN